MLCRNVLIVILENNKIGFFKSPTVDSSCVFCLNTNMNNDKYVEHDDSNQDFNVIKRKRVENICLREFSIQKHFIQSSSMLKNISVSVEISLKLSNIINIVVVDFFQSI